MTTFSIPSMAASVSAAAISVATESSITSSLGPAPDAEPAAESTQRIYSSHPIARLCIGRFQFEKSQLILNSASDIEEFEGELEWLATNQPTMRSNVKTLDLNAAAAFASQFSPAAQNGGSDTAMIRAGIAVQAAMSNAGPVGG